MIDGAECPPEFWLTNCANSPFDPFNPSDDQVQNDIIFRANDTSGVVDLNRIHRWRMNTLITILEQHTVLKLESILKWK